LLSKAKESGLKISGVTSIKNCTLEIRGTERMETLLSKDCGEKYISLLVEEANKRLLKTKEKTRRLLAKLS
jgi:tRNA(Phe) wybutosine-synthesizing methylase Tyw3